MHYSDTGQVVFWREREKEERALAAAAVDGTRAMHLRLADSYAILIAQTTGETEPDPDWRPAS